MPEDLIDSALSRVIELALIEDSGMGDLTSEAIVPEEAETEAKILLKEDAVVAGLKVAELVFMMCDPAVRVSHQVADGAPGSRGSIVSIIAGQVRGILRGERVALNLLQRMSGIATMTAAFVQAVKGTAARITDTRKTAPGLRVFDKWAVRLGGGVNHRFGLDDMVLIKDNHIAAAGGIEPAIRACRDYLGRKHLTIRIEIETRSLEEVKQAIAVGGVDRIMLDNMPVAVVQEAVRMINRSFEVEASGGITLDNVRAYAESGVDLISVGAITHSPRSIDLSLDIVSQTAA